MSTEDGFLHFSLSILSPAFYYLFLNSCILTSFFSFFVAMFSFIEFVQIDTFEPNPSADAVTAVADAIGDNVCTSHQMLALNV